MTLQTDLRAQLGLKLRNLLPLLTLLVFTAAVLSSCNYNDVKNISSRTGKAADGSGRDEPGIDVGIDFEIVKTFVFESACIKCHGPTLARAGLRLDTFEATFPNISAIRAEVEGGTMPPPPPRGATLSAEQKAMLMAWIDTGATETRPVAPAGAAGPSPLTPDFVTVSQAVFQPHCVKCHGAESVKGGVNLEVYASAAGHATKIRTALETDDMPRRAPPLPDDLKAIVFAWIAAGAPETVFPK